ncbi:caspase recruitment domain-containing protein 19 isoform X10 [Eubalaena glacialis]|uniref:caspase recruitment domain-containing protein 19 isoform X10 n=1 Tax=Eubalaena glacialis TaxID=27606 RepID=UPI002A5A3409|nr:caspase recruitment domain-containing protein 19 isoform X10 [Eubalaena glacialis]
MTEQTYCDRLVQDMPFLTGLGRLSEQQVDRIILQLNRYYPQILSNKDAEKVPRNLRLLSHPFLSGLGEAGGRTAWSSGTPRYLCEYVSATSWATCSGAVSGTARSSTGPCTSMPSPCTAACPAGTPCGSISASGASPFQVGFRSWLPVGQTPSGCSLGTSLPS